MLAPVFSELLARYTDNTSYITQCWEALKTRYTEKHRYYHNLDHLEHMFKEFGKVKQQVQEPDTLLFALFYHDIIYRITASDNEYQSALLFKEHIAKTSFPHSEAAAYQIEITKSHRITSDPDANLFLDVDLSILGQPWNVYHNYTQNIRKEYKRYPDFMYRKGRKKVLQHFLEAETIFKTLFFQDTYEQTARENLEQELQLLS